MNIARNVPLPELWRLNWSNKFVPTSETIP